MVLEIQTNFFINKFAEQFINGKEDFDKISNFFLAQISQPEFIKEIDSPKSSKFSELKQKIKKNTALWNCVIKPMLSINPKTRIDVKSAYSLAKGILAQSREL